MKKIATAMVTTGLIFSLSAIPAFASENNIKEPIRPVPTEAENIVVTPELKEGEMGITAILLTEKEDAGEVDRMLSIISESNIVQTPELKEGEMGITSVVVEDKEEYNLVKTPDLKEGEVGITSVGAPEAEDGKVVITAGPKEEKKSNGRKYGIPAGASILTIIVSFILGKRI